jgi:hypothetical protein
VPLVLIGARARQLSAIVERFGLEESALVASLELPAGEQQLAEFVDALGQ